MSLVRKAVTGNFDPKLKTVFRCGSAGTEDSHPEQTNWRETQVSRRSGTLFENFLAATQKAAKEKRRGCNRAFFRTEKLLLRLRH